MNASPPSQLDLGVFERMLLARRFEERCVELCLAGELPDALSVAIGQEATAAALGSALRPEDAVFTNHRNHAHLIGRGADPGRLMAEVFGKATGYCKGRAGTWHVSAPELGVPAASAIVAAGTALTVGAGLAFQQRREARVAVSCLGDRSLNEGTAWESVNLAALWRLPVVFLCENNDAVPYSPRDNSSLAAADLTSLIEPFGVAVQRVDGTDYQAVHAALSEAAERARAGGGPSFLETLTAAWPGVAGVHRFDYSMGPTSLAAAWSPPPDDRFHEWRSHDTILKTARALLDSGAATTDQVEEIDRRVTSAIDAAVDFARQSPSPDPQEALEGVFADA